ncbi:MAG: glycosyltransferase [Bacteroidota bacterium]
MSQINPQVAVIVVTFNSSKYVIETLESIKKQTWENLELIITDDCSTDNTVEICNKWLAENEKRFIFSKMITSLINTGISANINRGIKSITSSWLKLIAGDDNLLPNCITDNINYITTNSDASFVFSKGERINNKSEVIGKTGFPKKQMQYDIDRQFKEMLITPFVFTPSAFIKANVFEKTGFFNENSPMIEDYPMWIRATKVGFRMYYLDKETIQYRIHSESVSANNNFEININTFYANRKMLSSLNEIFNDEYLKDLKEQNFNKVLQLTKTKRKMIKSAINNHRLIFIFWLLIYKAMIFIYALTKS